jgi:hypothetical protein
MDSTVNIEASSSYQPDHFFYSLVATSAQAITPAPIPQPDGMIASSPGLRPV